MKTLISWIALEYDFDGNKISDKSPSMNIHKNGQIKYDQHIILSTEYEFHHQTEMLRSELDKTFLKCRFQIKYLGIGDPFDFGALMPKMKSVLDAQRQDEVDILFSNGTSVMRITWYILAEQIDFNVRLIQGKIISKEPFKSEFSEIKFFKSIPGHVIVKQSRDLSHHIPAPKQKVFEMAKKIARFDNISVLISGESGTGKEGMAKFIYESSPRNGKKFITVNCSALSNELLESRLFGYLKGSFTGAVSNKKGFFEEADGGVIFLDEIGDISPFMQQSLLRVLQEKVIIPVSGTKEQRVDVRIIAATNKNLLQLVAEGKFREDLYFRLAEAELSLPPLCKFDSDSINELIDYCIDEYQVVQRPKIKLVKEVREFLTTYNYPGNIRELSAIIKYLYVHGEEIINMEHLPDRLTKQIQFSRPSLKLIEVNKRHINDVYVKCGKNKQRTALSLGITVNTLKKYLSM